MRGKCRDLPAVTGSPWLSGMAGAAPVWFWQWLHVSWWGLSPEDSHPQADLAPLRFLNENR